MMARVLSIATQELRQESHEKVADVMAFLNDVEKKKTEGKEEDAIAMLDDLIAEDNQAKQPEPAPVTEAPPAQEGPRDLVALLEKLQQLIEVRCPRCRRHKFVV